MKMILGIFLGFFLMSQTAIAGDATKSEAMDDATDQQGSAEQFEQTLQESPTAAGLADMEKKDGEMTDQAQEPASTGEEADMYQEDTMEEPAQQ